MRFSISIGKGVPLNGFLDGGNLGQQYNIGEKPTVILYTYINRHAEPPSIIKQKTL